VDESVLQRAIKEVRRRVGMVKPVSCHTRPHALATHDVAVLGCTVLGCRIPQPNTCKMVLAEEPHQS
jgi:hypothetical protein